MMANYLEDLNENKKQFTCNFPDFLLIEKSG